MSTAFLQCRSLQTHRRLNAVVELSSGVGFPVKSIKKVLIALSTIFVYGIRLTWKRNSSCSSLVLSFKWLVSLCFNSPIKWQNELIIMNRECIIIQIHTPTCNPVMFFIIKCSKHHCYWRNISSCISWNKYITKLIKLSFRIK